MESVLDVVFRIAMMCVCHKIQSKKFKSSVLIPLAAHENIKNASNIERSVHGIASIILLMAISTIAFRVYAKLMLLTIDGLGGQLCVTERCERGMCSVKNTILRHAIDGRSVSSTTEWSKCGDATWILLRSSRELLQEISTKVWWTCMCRHLCTWFYSSRRFQNKANRHDNTQSR